MAKNITITPNKISLGQILTTCTTILVFSLALITYFQNQEAPAFFSYIIFLFIILPFSVESTLVCIYSASGKHERAVNVTLILCFIALLLSLAMLFLYNILPIFFSKYVLYIVLGGLAVAGIIFRLIMSVLSVSAEIYKRSWQSELSKCFYKLNQKIKQNKQSLSRIVYVSDSPVFKSIIEESLGGTDWISSSAILNGSLFLTNESVVIIFINPEEDFKKIIEGFEKKNNKIVGIIIIDFKLSKNQRISLDQYVDIIEECIID
ncbi:hypothetical protein KKG36_02945 [Patescibacteria group bacterium]|nr:hypothetical protein [Patescibacteria group bacterium]